MEWTDAPDNIDHLPLLSSVSSTVQRYQNTDTKYVTESNIMMV